MGNCYSLYFFSIVQILFKMLKLKEIRDCKGGEKMMKKTLLLVLGLVLVTALFVWAGGEQKQTQMSPEQMTAQMKADFAKCDMCKTMLPYMDQAKPKGQ